MSSSRIVLSFKSSSRCWLPSNLKPTKNVAKPLSSINTNAINRYYSSKIPSSSAFINFNNTVVANNSEGTINQGASNSTQIESSKDENFHPSVFSHNEEVSGNLHVKL
ncbi:Hypothetical protein PP7435_CHR1-1113 [Komagataella phaffii CBS 7435]|uniref:Uncharacterized protein n=2 Tax=Komagataella phaffii TaxID=460519 RepID=C4QY45_KOMPG|nr:Hypothetical protein PAS_chr1-4_0327 [Komagataella phaffii GS115]AOA61585.1 GQ67_01845T0 [Komagataella phaffii]KAI0464465.1 hypothetical protein LJB42_002080 [Komagataella kurtzmanii]CAH2446988.1 Hypothetical protein BQ9382_C1-5845 [Komagataella phaffii CBS 7435]AOA66821.1 GQ68_01860T0 [Komagataella phaffii GS115]CAY68168.1 Hypothetical protein PAS_chr1-4_0327 [Komagataella phaffii GS115]